MKEIFSFVQDITDPPPKECRECRMKRQPYTKPYTTFYDEEISLTSLSMILKKISV